MPAAVAFSKAKMLYVQHSVNAENSSTAITAACESTLSLLSPADTPLIRPTCQLLLHLAKQCRVVLKDAVCAAHRKC